MSGEALERYQNLGLRESLSLSYRYPLVCKELGVILRLGFSKSPKPLQSLLFEDTIAAFRLLPHSLDYDLKLCARMQTQSAVSAANLLSQSAAAALPKQKRGLAATEFKQAKVAYKRRFKTQQERKDLVQLPQDVIVHLFSFLDMQSLVSAGIVCWSWNAAASDNYLWQLHYITHFGDGEIIPKQKGHQSSRNFCEDANYDWKEAFRKAYLGLPSWRYKYNRGFCRFCDSIVWLNNLNCPKAHLSTFQLHGIQPLKPLSPSQLVRYVLENDTSWLYSSDSDSESDEEGDLKFWTFRY